MRLFILLLASVLGLSACYHPLYGDKPLGGAATAQEEKLNSIFIAPIDNESGQKLRNLLIDRMYGQGRPAKSDTRLEINLVTAEEHIGLQKNAITARARVTFTATYVLIDTATRKVLLKTDARSIANFNLLDEQYATLASRESTTTNALTELSDRMVNRLLVYFNEGK